MYQLCTFLTNEVLEISKDQSNEVRRTTVTRRVYVFELNQNAEGKGH